MDRTEHALKPLSARRRSVLEADARAGRHFRAAAMPRPKAAASKAMPPPALLVMSWNSWRGGSQKSQVSATGPETYHPSHRSTTMLSHRVSTTEKMLSQLARVGHRELLAYHFLITAMAGFPQGVSELSRGPPAPLVPTFHQYMPSNHG